MKKDKKIFIITELILFLLVIVTAVIMFLDNDESSNGRVSVIVTNSDDSRWRAFKYGLKMAAQDYGIELSFVSNNGYIADDEMEDIIEQEIYYGADALIIQTLSKKSTEELLCSAEQNIPILLVENTVSVDRRDSLLPSVEPDNYEMGECLAKELLKDFNGSISGKTLGIIGSENTEAVVNRKNGFLNGLYKSGADIRWCLIGTGGKNGVDSLSKKKKVDFIVALDDGGFTLTGKYAASNNFYGELIYGIGNSTDAVYYLDAGMAECLIVPDGFNMGYQSIEEVSKCLGKSFYKMEDKTVSYTVIRRDCIFSDEIQKMLFTMSQ